MKKTLLTLAVVMAGYYSYGQTNTAWSTSGNIGIGTTNPTRLLDIVSGTGVGPLKVSGPNGSLLIDNVGSGQSYYQANSFHQFQGTSGNPIMTILSTGNVGIGTTTPGTALDVKGIIRATTGGLQIGKFGVASNPVLAIGIDNPYFSSSAIINGWDNSSNSGISIGTIRNDGVAFSVVTGATLDANYLPSTPGTTALTVLGNSYVGIGTTTPDAKLAVKGTIHTQEVKVDMSGWGDYVFDKTYPLPTLSSVKTYIDHNHHLPEMPSETEVIKNGVNLGEMVKLQTEKIEELTLYLIEKDKQVASLQEQINQLAKKLNK